MGWTDERIANLAKLWGKGLSASQVAHQLGGVSRNAVIGKVHRLGLAGREAPAPCRTVADLPRSAPRPRAIASSMPRAPRAPAPAPGPQLPPVAPARPDLAPTASLLTLTGDACRWPIGDPETETFGFCGRPRDEAGPYCPGHAQRAFPARSAKSPNRAFTRWMSTSAKYADAGGR